MQRISILLVVGALLWGCQSISEEEGPFLLRLSRDNPTPGLAYERFVALDGETADALYYVDSRLQQLPSGQMRIIVNLKNARTEEIWVDWKAVFYDARDFQLEETEWHEDHFPVRETKTVTAQSIRRDVEKYTVMFRSAPQ